MVYSSSTGVLINGTAGADNLAGGAGDDTITGFGGSDSISGLGGNDSISGDAGSDTITGGSGADIFRFLFASDGVDTITDFISGTDKIQIDASNFNAGTGGLVAGTSLVPYNTSATTGTLFIGAFGNATGGNAGASAGPVFAYSTSENKLYVDRDGSNTGFTYQLLGQFGIGVSLSTSDFTIVA